MSCVKGFRKQEIAAWAHRHLRRETVVYSDDWPASGEGGSRL